MLIDALLRLPRARGEGSSDIYVTTRQELTSGTC